MVCGNRRRDCGIEMQIRVEIAEDISETGQRIKVSKIIKRIKKTDG